MCGIFGYVGNKNTAAKIVFDGLKRLDYRGYDSWGIGVIYQGKIIIDKHVGIIDEANVNLPKSDIGIGHTRWSTNGAVNQINAHPHYSSDQSFILAHNGIVENYVELKNQLLKQGFKFITDTDTEVIVRQIEQEKKTVKDLTEAVRISFKKLTGRNTILILSRDGQIIACRNGSPLVIGIKNDLSAVYLSSDTLSFAPNVDQILMVDNDQMVRVLNQQIELYQISDNQQIQYTFEKNDLKQDEVNKKGFKHYMLKEIFEEPKVIEQIIKQPDQIYLQFANVIHRAKHIYCIGSGTAGAGAAQMAFYLRTISKIPCIGLVGSEAQDYLDLIGADDLIIAPSQSGETADVLEVLEAAKSKGTKIASYVNMPGSMITRLSDFKFMANAGPEICVMSTKIFISQIAWGYLVAKAVEGKLAEGKNNLKNLSKEIDRFLKDKQQLAQLKNLAEQLIHKQHIFLLGKGQHLEIIKEGMVKLIEGAYVHAHAIPAGDLKHYAITLMEAGIPVIAVISNDNLRKDVLNAIHEVKARGADIIAIAPDNDQSFTEFIQMPDIDEVSAIMNTVPLQLLAYFMADALNHNVDKPRNIAKSVTVK